MAAALDIVIELSSDAVLRVYALNRFVCLLKMLDPHSLLVFQPCDPHQIFSGLLAVSRLVVPE